LTPSCPSINTDGTVNEVVPENAQDDISAGALAEAKEDLDNFFNSQLADAKAAAKYDTEECDDDCKAEFDKGAQAAKDKREEDWAELKALAGYETEDCDDTCKEVFEANLLAWEKDKYEACADNKLSIECSKALEIKKGVEELRAKGDKPYYAMTAEEREAADEAEKAEVEKNKATITAAVVDEPYAAGEDGSSCAEVQCSGAGQCCGTSTLKGTESDETPITSEATCAVATREVMIVGPAAAPGSWTDRTGREWSHMCLSMAKLGSSVAAAAVATYYM